LAAPTRREFPWHLAAGGAAGAAIALGIDDLRLRTFGRPSPPALDPAGRQSFEKANRCL